MHRAGEKLRKPQKQKKTYYFLEDMLFRSREGLLTKPNQMVVQIRQGFWKYPITFRELPLCTGNRGVFFSVAHKGNVLLSTWKKEGCTMGKGCVVSCWTVFTQVIAEQVMLLSTEGARHVKPSQSAILKYYYLSLSSISPSFLWVDAAQGNHGSGK